MQKRKSPDNKQKMLEEAEKLLDKAETKVLDWEEQKRISDSIPLPKEYMFPFPFEPVKPAKWKSG